MNLSMFLLIGHLFIDKNIGVLRTNTQMKQTLIPKNGLTKFITLFRRRFGIKSRNYKKIYLRAQEFKKI